MRTIFYSTLAASCLLSGMAFGQDDKPSSLGTEVTVVKPYTPSVSDAVKLNFKPAITDTATKKMDLNYSISLRQYKTQYEFAPIPAARISRAPLDKLDPFYVKLGLGSRSTSLAEIYFSSVRNRNWAYGLHGHHFASSGNFEGLAPSGFSSNGFSGFAKRFYKSYTLDTKASTDWNTNRYFGNSPESADPDSIKQRFFNFHVETALEGAENPYKQSLNSLKIAFDHTHDLTLLSEQDFRLNGILGKGLGDGLFQLGVGLRLVQTQFDTLNQRYFDFGFAPAFTGSEGDFNFTLGAKVHVNSELGAETDVYLYPNLNIEYSLLEGIFVIYGGVGGDLHQITVRELGNKNPWIATDAETGVTDESIRIFGGLKGAWSSKTSFTLGGEFSTFNHLPLFFLGQDSLSLGPDGRYRVVYDTLSRFRVFGELETNLGNRFSLTGALFVDAYSNKFQEKPWHLPSVHGRVSAVYNLRDKILVKARLYGAGKRFVGTDGDAVETLNPFTDLGLGLTYRYNSAVSAFIEVDNLLNQSYEQYLLYPAQGTTIRGGLSIAF